MTDSKWVPIRDAIENAFAFAGKFILPVLGGALKFVPNVPGWVAIVVTTVLPGLMDIAEKDLPEPGSGPMKKQKVMDAMDGILAVLEKLFTGGAAGTFAKIKEPLGEAIDQIVKITNELAPEIVADDAPEPPAITGN